MKTNFTDADSHPGPFHLVTPQSRGEPLCGETSPDAAIGAYVEHLDENGDFVREVMGNGGKSVTACPRCLELYPSVLWQPRQRLTDCLTLQTVIKIAPYPHNMREEFSVTGSCISADYEINPTPSVVGQYVDRGRVAISLLTHIVPTYRKRG